MRMKKRLLLKPPLCLPPKNLLHLSHLQSRLAQIHTVRKNCAHMVLLMCFYSVSVSNFSVSNSYLIAVVSINDSEDLSSPVSEEEEEEESDQAEEEEGEEEVEEDSGSEVEIIEEVQGNGRLPPLTPSSVFVQEGLTHFLPTLSEQEVSDFSLITPGAEMKVIIVDVQLVILYYLFVPLLLNLRNFCLSFYNGLKCSLLET